MLNNVPKVALAPLFVIWLGTGSASKIAVGILVSFFVVVIDAVLGLRSLNADMVDLGRLDARIRVEDVAEAAAPKTLCPASSRA